MHETVKVRHTSNERRTSLIILSVAIVIIVIIVIIGVCVQIFLDAFTSKIILLCLIGMVLLIGLIAFFFLEMQRKEALRKKDLGASQLVQQIYEDQRRQKINFNGDAEENTSTWALTQPWRYSQRSTLKV